MVVLFAPGVMSLLWMAVVAGVIFAEKVLPQGSPALGLPLVALGIWLAYHLERSRAEVRALDAWEMTSMTAHRVGTRAEWPRRRRAL